MPRHSRPGGVLEYPPASMVTSLEPISHARRDDAPKLIAGLLVVLVFVTFGRIATHEFLSWDDEFTLVTNPRLNPPTWSHLAWYWHNPEYGLYMPLTYTVWAGLAAIGQTYDPQLGKDALNPYIFHLASIGLHMLSTLVVFATLRRLIRSDWPAAAGAALFAVHPVQVESVAWASGMKDLLCGLGVLTAVWQYIASAQASAGMDHPSHSNALEPSPGGGGGATESNAPARPRLHYALATLAFVAAMLCKPAAVVAPAIALVIDLMLLRRPLRRIAPPIWLWIALALPIMWVAKLVQPGIGIATVPAWARPLVAADALAFYLYKLVWPVNLALDYARLPTVALSKGWVYFTWVVPAVVAAAAWLVRRRAPQLVASALIFVAGVAPVLGFTPFLFQYYSTVADHYLYMSMLGVALAAAWAARELSIRNPGRWAGVIGAGAIVIVALSVRSIVQAGAWRDDLTAFGHGLKISPDSLAANTNLGVVHMRRQEWAQAERLFRRAIELRPEYSRAHDNLAKAMLAQGRVAEALVEIEETIRRNEQMPPGLRGNTYIVRILLGRYYLSRGRPADALAQFEVARSLEKTESRIIPDPDLPRDIAAGRAALERPEPSPGPVTAPHRGE
ncbi:MAG: tetratricopeptide repeat protein [Tepidisphaeraceae bacterium]